MKLRFNKHYVISFLLLIGIEACIAIFLKDGFIRYTVGDFLAVIMLYCFFKSFIKANSLYIAIATLLIAYVIEFMQLTNVLRYKMLEDMEWLSLVFGSHFSVQDLIAYSLGTISVLYLDTFIQFQLNSKTKQQ